MGSGEWGEIVSSWVGICLQSASVDIAQHHIVAAHCICHRIIPFTMHIPIDEARRAGDHRLRAPCRLRLPP